MISYKLSTSQTTNECLKEFLYLIIKYINKRCNYFDTMSSIEYIFILKIIDQSFNLFFNCNPTLNDILEQQKIPDYYNADYTYIRSFNHVTDIRNIPQENIENQFQNLIKIDSKKVYF